MRKIKKVLIVLIVLIIIIIGVLVILSKTNKNLNPDEVEFTPDIIINDTLQKVSIRNNYYTVKNIVEKYYSSLCNLNKTSENILVYEGEEVEGLNEKIAKEVENTKNRIYNFFNEDYIEETGLTINNIKDKLGNYNNLYVLIDKMYVRDITESLKIYFVFGNVTEKETLKTENFELMLVIDSNNSTFNIYTSEYINKHNLYELSNDADFNEKELGITEIENRTYNKYDYEIVNDETYAKDLLKSYTQPIKYNNINYSYNNLHQEYKTNRFKELAEYKEYIQENKNKITTATLKYYKVNKYDGYKQYICMDQSGKYYIFNETSIMNYTLILDTYTIDLPEFTLKYATATTEEKVMLNIEKIVEALNGKDYNYIYSKLADEFKANYFKTYEDFEEYAENTFDIGNEVTYNQYTESENYCTYKITLKGKNKTVTKTIVMRLEEEANFVMSFSVE